MLTCHYFMFYCPTPFLPFSISTRIWYQVNELVPDIFLISRVARLFSFQCIFFYFLHLILEKLPKQCLKNVAEYPLVVMPLASIDNQYYILPPLYQEIYTSSVCRVHSPTNALFINLKNTLKFTLKYT